MIHRINPGSRIHFIPGIGINIVTPRSAAAAILLHDTFTDTNDTPLSSHTPEIGGPWDLVQIPFKISSDNAVLINTAPWGYQAVQFAACNYVCALTFSVPTGYSGEGIGCYVRSSQFYAGYGVIGLVINSSALVIRNSSAGTTFVSTAWTGTKINRTLTVHVSGATITAMLDDSTTISYTFAGDLDSTACGIRARYATDLFHEITITAL